MKLAFVGAVVLLGAVYLAGAVRGVKEKQGRSK